MPEYLSPGVYIEEFEVGAKPIEGVGTSTAAFVGLAEKGPMNKPELITDMGRFTETFGGHLKKGCLAYSVGGFFENGGKRCFVVRVSGTGCEKSKQKFKDGGGVDIIEVRASSEGEWGNDIKVEVGSGEAATGVLYLSAITEDTKANDKFFKATNVRGLSIGDVVMLSDGAKQDSGELTVTGIDAEGNVVNVNNKINKVFSKDNTRAVVVVKADADSPAAFSSVVSSASGFAKGNLVSFLSPSGDPLYVNLTGVSEKDRQLTWEGKFKDKDGNPSTEVPGGAFVETRRVELKFRLGSKLDAGSTEIKFADLNGTDQKKISVGDTLTIGGGSEAETTKVKNVAVDKIGFATATKSDHLANESLKALTYPHTGIFSKKSNPFGVTFDTGINGFKEEDVFVFTKDGANEEIKKITSVSGTQVTLESAPGNDKNMVSMKWKADQFEVVVDDTTGFYAGDLVKVSFGGGKEKVLTLDKVEHNRLFFKANPGEDIDKDASLAVMEWKATAVKALAFGLNVLYKKNKREEKESFNSLSLNPESTRYFAREGVINKISRFIEVEDLRKEEDRKAAPSVAGLPRPEAFTQLKDGGNGFDKIKAMDFIGKDSGGGNRTGLVALEPVDDVNILCIPDIGALNKSDDFNDDDVIDLQAAMISHCEKMKDRFAVLDSVYGKKAQEILDWKQMNNLESKYAALYYPWFKVMDPIEVDGGRRFVPPSGHVAGIYARSDVERGVHKAPANEKLNRVPELEFKLTAGEQDMLNPKGINCIRAFPGRGIRVWGARTLSSDPLWKYVNIRRFFNYLEESIDESTQWVVFEPNSESLWARVKQTVAQFLTDEWRKGALMGLTVEEAFYVKCDRTTMSQLEIDNGKLVCEIGVSPVKPAEFVVFRIAQWTADANI